MRFKKSHSSWGASGIARRDIRHDKTPNLPRVKRSGILHAPNPVDPVEEFDRTQRRVRTRRYKTPVHTNAPKHVHEWTDQIQGPTITPLGHWQSDERHEYYHGYHYRTCECGARRRGAALQHELTELNRDGRRIFYECVCGERFWWQPGRSPRCVADYRPGRYGHRLIYLREGDKPHAALKRGRWW